MLLSGHVELGGDQQWPNGGHSGAISAWLDGSAEADLYLGRRWSIGLFGGASAKVTPGVYGSAYRQWLGANAELYVIDDCYLILSYQAQLNTLVLGGGWVLDPSADFTQVAPFVHWVSLFLGCRL